jgi:hypothetical protein
MSASTTTSIKLDDDLKARLKALAATRRRTVHWLMREAIAEYVAREEGGAEAPRAPAPQPPPSRPPLAAAPPPSQEAYEWLAQLEAKGVSVRPSRRRL